MKINFSFLYRKKNFDSSNVESTNLSRVLKLLDLTALGVSSTLGSGVYVLIGNIVANYAGPSILISFLLAGFCSLLAGLCYAELGSRVPRSGSAYVYIYITVGEFMAFIIGWDVILEYVIGTSSAASALSKYIDSLFDNEISKSLKATMPINVGGLSEYPDFLAFGFAIIVTLFLIIGVKESSFLNTIFTGMNLCIILFIIFFGAVKANIKNWRLSVNSNLSWIDFDGNNSTCSSTKRCGDGGFAPFGFMGIIKGTAKCFYAYIGFDCIATTGEEVVNPKRTIPLSILFTLLIVSLCYIGVSAVLTLMVPYYIIDQNIPIPFAFSYVGLEWTSYIVSAGAIVSLATCLYASMFPMPRVVYAMSSDGLIFKFLSYILPKIKTPALAALATGLLSAVLALLFDLNHLIDMMSIGTLMAYSLVSVCTLILRYRPNVIEPARRELGTKRTLISYIVGESDEKLVSRIFKPMDKCDKASSHLVNAITAVAVVDIIILCILLNYTDILRVASFVFIMIFLILLLFFTFLLWLQPQNKEIETFKVPLVPFFPIISTLFNLYLMISLNGTTWVRFLVWFGIGLLVYFLYGIRNSNLNVKGSHQNYFFPCFEKSYATMEETPQENNNESEL